MSKIGYLSVFNHNYGSILQAYALQTVLQRMGDEPEIIVYKKTNVLKQAKRLLYYPLLKATVKMMWKGIYCRFFQKEIYNRILVSREEAFREFIDSHLIFSKVYAGRKALIKGTKSYDAFVLGSDQVWNPMNLGGDFYTMTFIPENIGKIAYAPSFGVSIIPNNQKKKTADYLKRIDYVSVRESEGVSIVKELTGRDVPQVIDPTMLVDKEVWDEEKGKRLIQEDYIFCYFISANKAYREFSKRLSKYTGLKILSLPHVDEFVKTDVDFGDIEVQGVGPLQFVNLISNSSYVCTDSFHGSVFATLYEKTFFTFSRHSDDGLNSTNSRLYSFLKLVNMESRMYMANSEITENDIGALDFTKAKANLESLRNESIKYLCNALLSVRRQ